eukprot:scaffold764_cov408-Prasinococcus_capsulatus_cf.AAC.4
MLASLSRTVYRTLSRPYLGARGAFLSTQSAHSDARDGTTQAVRMLSGTAATVLVTGGLLAHYTTEPVRTEKAVPEHSKTALSPEVGQLGKECTLGRGAPHRAHIWMHLAIRPAPETQV